MSFKKVSKNQNGKTLFCIEQITTKIIKTINNKVYQRTSQLKRNLKLFYFNFYNLNGKISIEMLGNFLFGTCINKKRRKFPKFSRFSFSFTKIGVLEFSLQKSKRFIKNRIMCFLIIYNLVKNGPNSEFVLNGIKCHLEKNQTTGSCFHFDALRELIPDKVEFVSKMFESKVFGKIDNIF